MIYWTYLTLVADVEHVSREQSPPSVPRIHMEDNRRAIDREEVQSVAVT